MLRFLSAFLLLEVFWGVSGSITVNTDTSHFQDEYGRTRIFHGMNAVYKIAPWHPNLEGFDVNNSLSDVDAQLMKSWGMNVVRLGVMWPGLEPGAQGVYNTSYLDAIQTIVENLANEGIYVLLDLHQDLLHRKWCGEGVPDYFYDVCKASFANSTKPFPSPVAGPLPVDEEGNPEYGACLETMFATYYLSYEVSDGFQCLYENVGNLWDAMAGYWKQVAQRFHTFDNVLGYDLINEPSMGDMYKHPGEVIPGDVEKKYLKPLYDKLNTAIRSVDTKKIVFFEGLTIDYWPSGFAEVPGGREYSDRSAISYHIYCPLHLHDHPMKRVCAGIDDEFFASRTADVHRLGCGWMMTEFGAIQDTQGDLEKTATLLQLADKHAQSWMYWTYKYFQDITTCTPLGETMFNDDGTVSVNKLKLFSRTYPMATAGILHGYNFEPESASFQLTYSLVQASASVEKKNWEGEREGESLPEPSLTSEIFINRELYYPHGASVSVSGAGSDVVNIVCSSDSNMITIVQNDLSSSSDPEVTVSITPCGDSGGQVTCNC